RKFIMRRMYRCSSILARISHTRRDLPNGLLINTPLQRGAPGCNLHVNRFNGFSHGVETVETVEDPDASANTPLKRGVNEIYLFPGPQRVKYPG
ncbi:MAG: hypothetical protein NTW03_02785, partial [Verrucomicrobia bacterium]|nr:hypothetical protein [Verrucomicrobiota bacterium]